MATDVKESDTDDHDSPAPPKRQCTRTVKVNDTCWDTEKLSNEKEETTEDLDNTEYDDVERHAREKLKKWQAHQEARGYIDNTINRVLDRFRVFRKNYMEERAVMMAICHHGLVQSGELVSQSRALYSDKAPGYCTNNEYKDIHCSCRTNDIQGIGNFPSSLATTSTNSLRLNTSGEMDQYNNFDWDADKVDDQQEHLLERAVAEAIRKKGLSALGVDYG